MVFVTAGPFKVNGVPLRRVNQAYVIATSTKVDISSVDVAKYADAYFKRAVTKTKKGESEFFEAEKEVILQNFRNGLELWYICFKSNAEGGILTLPAVSIKSDIVFCPDRVMRRACQRRRRKTRRLLMPS